MHCVGCLQVLILVLWSCRWNKCFSDLFVRDFYQGFCLLCMHWRLFLFTCTGDILCQANNVCNMSVLQGGSCSSASKSVAFVINRSLVQLPPLTAGWSKYVWVELCDNPAPVAVLMDVLTTGTMLTQSWHCFPLCQMRLSDEIAVRKPLFNSFVWPS